MIVIKTTFIDFSSVIFNIHSDRCVITVKSSYSYFGLVYIYLRALKMLMLILWKISIQIASLVVEEAPKHLILPKRYQLPLYC